jgi:hypothetical protein
MVWVCLLIWDTCLVPLLLFNHDRTEMLSVKAGLATMELEGLKCSQ